jgi:hypothetical protein
MVGFRFEETMRGEYRRDGEGAERSFSFRGRAETHNLRDFFRTETVTLKGTVTMEGIANDKPLEGSMVIAPLTRGYIAYDFAFQGDDGERYQFTGAKHVKLLALAHTMTTLYGRIIGKKGEDVGRAVVRFDLKNDLARFLGSFRLVGGGDTGAA